MLKIKDLLDCQKIIKKQFYFKSVFVSAIVILLLTIGTLFFPWKISHGSQGITVTIQRGMSPSAIARILRENGIINSRLGFLAAAKLLRVTKKLQAGQYHFKGLCNNYYLLNHLVKGKVVLEPITFPEGIRAIKIASLVQEKFNVDSTYFMMVVMDQNFCNSHGISASSLEGFLYPDTYFFPNNPDAEEIIESMVSRFHQVFNKEMQLRTKRIQRTTQEVVTLASIVEGEAVIDSERPTIAALYLNRLKKEMLLQADPTIQYIIPDGPRRLTTRDLQIESKYNTYRYKGLPPGPVNNPGLASINAVLFPDSVNYLFMVANGDGSHTFSNNISEHIAAKRRFDRIRRYHSRY